MGKHITPLEKLCTCGAKMQSVHMKGPHIDDYETECTNPACQHFARAIYLLNGTAQSDARRAQ